MSTTVAVVGLNGFLGKPVVEGLLSEPFISKISTPIRLVTHNPSKKVITSDKVEYIDSNSTSYEDAFKGVDVVINLTNPTTSPLSKILDGVVANKVKLYIPSQFGVDIAAVSVDFPGLLEVKTQHSESARKAGIKTVDISSSFFFDGETFLGFELPFLKVDEKTNSVELIGDESSFANPSYFRDIGLATAAIATHDDYSKLPNKVRIYSDEVTLGDLIARYEKKHGVKLNKKHIDAVKFYNDLKEKHAENGSDYGNFLGYLNAIRFAGEGKGATFVTENEKEIINPGESLFKWSKFPRD